MSMPERDNCSNYHEIREHAAREFPFNIYPCSIPVDFKQVPVHWHEELGMVVFPGQLHGIGQWKGEVMEYENIMFRPSMLMTADTDVCTVRYLTSVAEGCLKLPLHIKKELAGYDEMMDCIGWLDDLSETKGYGYEVGVKGLLDYIETHYGEHMGVREPLSAITAIPTL